MAPHITSPHNPRVKETLRLRNRRHREQSGRILIDGGGSGPGDRGRRGARRGVSLPAAVPHGRMPSFAGNIPASGAEILEVSEPVFAKLAFGDRAEGVLGVAERPQADLARLALPEQPLLAVLEGVEKPGNVGALLRSANGAGLSALIVADGGTDLFDPNAIRASLGTILPCRSPRPRRPRCWPGCGPAPCRFTRPGWQARCCIAGWITVGRPRWCSAARPAD